MKVWLVWVSRCCLPDFSDLQQIQLPTQGQHLDCALAFSFSLMRILGDSEFLDQLLLSSYITREDFQPLHCFGHLLMHPRGHRVYWKIGVPLYSTEANSNNQENWCHHSYLGLWLVPGSDWPGLLDWGINFGRTERGGACLFCCRKLEKIA